MFICSLDGTKIINTENAIKIFVHGQKIRAHMLGNTAVDLGEYDTPELAGLAFDYIIDGMDNNPGAVLDMPDEVDLHKYMHDFDDEDLEEVTEFMEENPEFNFFDPDRLV